MDSIGLLIDNLWMLGFCIMCIRLIISFDFKISLKLMAVYSKMICVSGDRVTKVSNDARNVSIPSTVKYIGFESFKKCDISSINLSDTQIVIIETGAFSDCYDLQEIILPSSLEEIGDKAFFHCYHLRNIYFSPDSRLKKIGSSAFYECISLEHIEFPSLLERIGKNSFFGCELKKFDFGGTRLRYVGESFTDRFSYSVIIFPQTISLFNVIKYFSRYQLTIEESPITKRDKCGYYFSSGMIFQGEKYSKHIMIRRGVRNITKYCFYGASLVSITIPASVVKISDFAFDECSQLKKIRFAKDSQLIEIGWSAFSYCSLRIVRFPKSLKFLRNCPFLHCQYLEHVIFPHDSELESIEKPFIGTIIRQLSLPPSVKKIIGACEGMMKLEKISINNEYFQSNDEGTAIFSKDGSELVTVLSWLRHFEIPEGVRFIKEGAFHSSEIIGKILIPSSVEVVEADAFSQIRYLTSIEFAEGSKMRSVGSLAFYNVNRLILNNEHFKMQDDGSVFEVEDGKFKKIIFEPPKQIDWMFYNHY